MPARDFVDTNVLVYAVDDSEPSKRDTARSLLAAEDKQFVISTQVLSEFYVVVTRRLREPLSDEDAADAVRVLAMLPVVVVDKHVVLRAVDLSRTSQISFWDAQILTAARAGGCGRLLTEDLSHGTELDSVLIENPFA